MRKFFDTILDPRGEPVQNAEVRVTDGAGNPVQLYSDNAGATLDQPALTTELGYYEFYVANGNYTLDLRYPGAPTRLISSVEIYDDTVQQTTIDQLVSDVANLKTALPMIPGATAVIVGARSGMSAIVGQEDGTPVYLTESGREGTFVWRLGDYSTQVAADPDQDFYVEADAVSADTGAWVRMPTNDKFTPSGTGAINTTVQTELRRQVWAERYGLSPTASAADNATAFLNAVAALRGPSFTLTTDGLGSGSLTVYTSGTLYLGEGIFPIASDVLQFTQDHGLKIIGQGTRGTANAVRGRTVLLITGASSGFGIQMKGNGARALCLEDLDLCYADASFTGDVLDVYSTPGVTLNRVHLGTNGTSGATRYQSARSCLRCTYDEFLHLGNVTMDGAIEGWWSDDTREPSAGFSDFGGSQTTFSNVTTYDFSGRHYRHDGNRTRAGLVWANIAINPIQIASVRGIDVNNVDAFVLTGGANTSSGAGAPSQEWVRMTNVTGQITGFWCGDLARAGTLAGAIVINGNVIYSTDGFRLLGGTITGSANEFSKAAAGFTVAYNATVTNATDNGSGLVRITAANHGFPSGMQVAVSGVTGVAAANTTASIVTVDENTFDMLGTTFAGAYTSGGKARCSTPLSFALGPDVFKPAVTYSYSCLEPSAAVAGAIHYAAGQDASASKVNNAGSSIAIRNTDQAEITENADFTASNWDSGRTYVLTKSGSQAVTLPVPIVGLELTFFRPTTDAVTLTCAAATNIYSGVTAADTAASASGNVGALLTLRSYGTAGWSVRSVVGTWSFT